MEGQPIRCRIENPVNRPLNQIFYAEVVDSCKKNSIIPVSVGFLISMKGDIIFAIHIYIDINRNPILFNVLFF